MLNLIGDRVKQVRTSFHLNQREFCQKIDLPQSRLSEIESGKIKPSYTALQGIAETFSVSLDWLILGKGQMAYVQSLVEQNISPEELQLLSGFRKLSDVNKIKIEGMIEMKLAEEKEQDRKLSRSHTSKNADCLA